MPSLLAIYLHRIDPYAIMLWEGGPIRWYGLSYLLGFVLGYCIIKRIVRLGHSPLHVPQVMDLVFAIAIGIMIGGRLGSALFYDQALFYTFTSRFPYWDLLALNRGGMASHGGLIGLVVAAGWFAHRHKINLLHLLDLTAFAGSIGLFFGRLANFINGELFGRPCAPDFVFAVRFPQEMYHWSADQLHELSSALTTIVPGNLSLYERVDWAIGKIQSGNQQVIRAVEPLLMPRHPSQIYEAILEGLVLFGVLAIVWIKPRKPGIIFGLCCTVYSIVRIFVEQFREPDANIRNMEYAVWHITRGQILSSLMLVVGIIILTICTRRRADPVGGWLG